MKKCIMMLFIFIVLISGCRKQDLDSQMLNRIDDLSDENKELMKRNEALTQRVDELENQLRIVEQVTFIMGNIRLHMTKDEVVESLGKNYAEVSGAAEHIGASKMYRYDLVHEDEYNYASEMDEVDVDGLKNGDVSVILFISWNSQYEINNYTMYYRYQRRILEYRVFEDGTIRTSYIN